MNLIERRRGMRVANESTVLVLYPNGYTELDGTIANSGNAYTPYDTTTQATVTGRSCKFTFDMSSLPSDSTIVSAACIVTVQIGASARNIVMWAGNTKKTSQSVHIAKETKTFDLSSWNVNELKSIALQITHSSTGAMYFYGATLTIKYTI